MEQHPHPQEKEQYQDGTVVTAMTGAEKKKQQEQQEEHQQMEEQTKKAQQLYEEKEKPQKEFKKNVIKDTVERTVIIDIQQ